MIKNIKNFFGLKKMPFSKNIATTELYQSQPLQNVRSRLNFALENEDFFLVTGVAGSGKSTALRFSLSQVDPHMYPFVYITAENYNIGDIAKLFLSGLNVQSPYQGFKALNTLKKTVSQMSVEKCQKPILLIDEAQQLPITTLMSIKNIVNFNMDSKSRILIILCGQKELLNKLKSISLESLRRRIRIYSIIEPLSVEDCSKYISHQMKQAGIDRKLFSEEIIAEIYRVSKGNICNINNICFELLIQAASNSYEIIELSLMDKIILP